MFKKVFINPLAIFDYLIYNKINNIDIKYIDILNKDINNKRELINMNYQEVVIND